MHQILKKTFKTSAFLCALVAVGAAQSGPVVLTKLDDKQVLDPSTNLVWLSDWNLAKTSGYNVSGQMTWSESLAWIAKLNADNYAGYNNWRLAKTDTTASSNCGASYTPAGGFGDQYFGRGCTGSEMGHLFYEVLGGKDGESILNQRGDTAVEKANLALFENVQSDFYWTGTEYAPDSNDAWMFATNEFSLQNHHSKDLHFYALAVRPGDVSTTVPEPQTLALVLIALTGALLVHRRRAL